MKRLGLALLLGLAAGCAKPAPEPPPIAPGPALPDEASEPPEPAAGKVTIGVSVLTLTHDFFQVIADSMRESAKELGWEVVVVSGEFDAARQDQQVDDFIVQGVDAIVLCPCDSQSVGTAIKKANAAGIPVFTADIAAMAEGIEVVSHIATDNHGGGVLAAKALIEALDGQGKVAVIDHPQVESVILRTKGFHEELERARREDGVTIEVVQTVPGGGDKEKAFRAAEDLLQAHGDLAGIFAINDPSALGAVAAIEKAGRAGRIVVVGFDGQPEGKQAILEGKIFADPIQYPDRIGAMTIDAIDRYLRGEEVEPEIRIPTSLYYQADAQADPELKGDA